MAYGSGLYGQRLYGVSYNDLTASGVASAATVTRPAFLSTASLSAVGIATQSTATAPQVTQIENTHALTGDSVAVAAATTAAALVRIAHLASNDTAAASAVTSPQIIHRYIIATGVKIIAPTLWTGGQVNAEWSEATGADGIWTDAAQVADTWQEVA